MQQAGDISVCAGAGAGFTASPDFTGLHRNFTGRVRFRPKTKPQQLVQVAGVLAPEWLRGPAATETDIRWWSSFEERYAIFRCFRSSYHSYRRQLSSISLAPVGLQSGRRSAPIGRRFGKPSHKIGRRPCRNAGSGKVAIGGPYICLDAARQGKNVDIARRAVATGHGITKRDFA